jgi:hypothetical protein
MTRKQQQSNKAEASRFVAAVRGSSGRVPRLRIGAEIAGWVFRDLSTKNISAKLDALADAITGAPSHKTDESRAAYLFELQIQAAKTFEDARNVCLKFALWLISDFTVTALRKKIRASDKACKAIRESGFFDRV